MPSQTSILETALTALQNRCYVSPIGGSETEMAAATGCSRPAGWQHVLRVCERVLEQPPGERRVALDEACHGDIALRWQVERLMAQADSDEAPQLSQRLAQILREGLDTASLGTVVGGYRLQHRLGSGRMGTVYQATQESTQRTVALKILRLGLRSDAAVQRFHFETRRLSALLHPGVAQLIEAGTHVESDSVATPFVAMEYVSAPRSLVVAADADGLDLSERLELFCRACDAVHHGHQKGVLHREIKPANLLVDGAGQLKVVDFGLARAVGADQAQACLSADPGQVLETLPYLSPERLISDSPRIDTRSDIYSLGVVLFELLCGRLPHDLSGVPLFEAAQILRSAPRLTEAPGLPPRLRDIVLRALEGRPEDRYSSVARFSAAIRRFLRRRCLPVAQTGGRRVSTGGSSHPSSGSWRWGRRAQSRPSGTSALASGALGMVLLSTALVAWNGASTSRDKARRAEQRAQAVEAALVEVASLAGPGRLGQEARLVDALSVVKRDLLGYVQGRPGADHELATVIDALSPAAHHSSLTETISSGAAAPEASLAQASLSGTASGESLEEALVAMDNLARLYGLMGQRELSFVAGEQRSLLMAASERRDGPGHPGMHHHQAQLLMDHGRTTAAVNEQRVALGLWRQSMGSDHVDTRRAVASLGVYLTLSGQMAEGEALLREALAQARASTGDTALPEPSAQVAQLAWNLVHQQRGAEATRLVEQVLTRDEARGRQGELAWHTALRCKGRLLAQGGAVLEAEPWLRAAVEALPTVDPDGGWRTRETKIWYDDVVAALDGDGHSAPRSAVGGG